MVLEQSNFIVKMLVITMNENEFDIKSYDITDKMSGFTNKNCSQTLGTNIFKYKLMFQNLKIEKENYNYICFEIFLNINNNYYTPHLFFTIDINDMNQLIEHDNRTISYNLYKDTFNHIWIYLDRLEIDKIINNNNPLNLESFDKLNDDFIKTQLNLVTT